MHHIQRKFVTGGNHVYLKNHRPFWLNQRAAVAEIQQYIIYIHRAGLVHFIQTDFVLLQVQKSFRQLHNYIK